MRSVLGTETECELASAITSYIWYDIQEHQLGDHHSYTAENGDERYTEEAQDIFNRILDVVSEVTGVEDEEE